MHDKAYCWYPFPLRHKIVHISNLRQILSLSPCLPLFQLLDDFHQQVKQADQGLVLKDTF